MIITLHGGPLGGLELDTETAESEKKTIPVGEPVVATEFVFVKAKDDSSGKTCVYRVEGDSGVYTGME